jgi:hypothetical protein
VRVIITDQQLASDHKIPGKFACLEYREWGRVTAKVVWAVREGRIWSREKEWRTEIDRCNRQYGTSTPDGSKTRLTKRAVMLSAYIHCIIWL